MAEKPTVTLINNEEKESTQQIKNVISFIDKKNRKIVLKKPNVLAEYRIVEIVGDTAKNETYMLMIMPLLFVNSIDDEIVNVSSKLELEALITRLDDTVSEVVNKVRENFYFENKEDAKEKIKK